MKKNKKGFTLIELLVVIAIIGLLSTLAIASLSDARARARDVKKLSVTKQLSKLLSIYASNNPNTQVECTGGCTTDNDASTISGPLGLSDFSSLEIGNYFIDVDNQGGSSVSTIVIYFELEEDGNEVTAGCKQINYEGNVSAYDTDGDSDTCP